AVGRRWAVAKTTTARPMNDREIQSIIDRVMREIGGSTAPAATPEPPARTDRPTGRSNGGYGAAPPPATTGDYGVYPSLDEAAAAARAAFMRLNAMPLAIRQDMVAHMRRAARENALLLAEMAQSETGMGRVEDKVLKNILNADKAPGTEALEPRAWSGDGGLTLVEYAPYGVIGALTPSTNPTSTVICNAIGMVAAGNAVVFNAHPSAKGASNRTVQILNRAILAAGGPADLLTRVANPTLECAQALMEHKLIRLL